jgi:hypothetical protein
VNDKIISITKTASSIFLTIVLVTGTIAAISPQSSSFIVGAQAQQYFGMDRYDDRKSYGNDNSYKSPYQSSYKSDYKPTKYPSYGEKDDKRDKSSKNNSKSVDINKIKCINTNININGNNTGNVSIGNKEQRATVGEGYYDNGDNNKKDKGFTCIINNNNNNIVVQETSIPPVNDCPEAEDIEACFEEYFELGFERLLAALESPTGITIEINGQDVTFRSFNDICEAFKDLTFTQLREAIFDIVRAVSNPGQAPIPVIAELIPCIAEALDIPIPPR